MKFLLFGRKFFSESVITIHSESTVCGLDLFGAKWGNGFIGQFKSVCTKRIRAVNDPEFQWQSRFHDHIIRNEPELFRIRQYIRNNPAKWERDRNR